MENPFFHIVAKTYQPWTEDNQNQSVLYWVTYTTVVHIHTQT